ncbi:MAG TPA: PP2C family protein-serine/threonine phosphatase [Candidatus Baltobacteraceae bacterium]|nr:PP2C family protein-serine/threonine phosphatase [Candidatus Baltobacteraceae bacterium]
MTFDQRVYARPLVTEAVLSPAQKLAAQEPPAAAHLSEQERAAAELLIRHLFATSEHRIDGVEYHAAYALAEGAVGGDIVDVFHFDNGNVALSIADISGKGAAAAVHAAVVKYGLRCYASEGLTAERVLRSLDRVYIENNAFERTESFASVFVGILDRDRRSLAYASAGHEPVMLCRPGAALEVLHPTAPLIGVFDDQNHLFKQRHIEIEPGTILVLTTDGATEARSPGGELFGMERLAAAVSHAVRSATTMEYVVGAVMREVERFCDGRLRDDIAVLAVRVF